MGIYLDNGATSYPKPKVVEEAILNAIRQNTGSASRSHSSATHQLEREIYDTRVMIAEYFNFAYPDHVVFTKNVTESINLVLSGFIRESDHVVVTVLEHNAVLRTLENLKKNRNITYTVVPLDHEGQLDWEVFERSLLNETRLIVTTHASNVSGDILDIHKIGLMAKAKGIPYLLDSAQTAGTLEIDMVKDHIDMLAFTGHKSLLGPTGIGGILINPDLVSQIEPFVFGGTGSASESLNQPQIMPDKYEAGTPNVLGILGLGASIKYLSNCSFVDSIAHERFLISHLQEGVESVEGVRIIGNKDNQKRTGILSLDFTNHDNSMVAHALSKQFDISTRVGLHCAPIAHKAYGSYPNGTIRFSVSRFNTIEEINLTVKAIHQVIKK